MKRSSVMAGSGIGNICRDVKNGADQGERSSFSRWGNPDTVHCRNHWRRRRQQRRRRPALALTLASPETLDPMRRDKTGNGPASRVLKSFVCCDPQTETCSLSR